MLAAQQQPRHCGHRQLPLAIVGSHIMHNHAQHSCRPGVGPYSASSRGGASRGARARARCGAPARRAAAARALGPGGGQPRAPGTRATPAPWARPGPAAPALRPADWSNRDVGGRSCTPDASQNSGRWPCCPMPRPVSCLAMPPGRHAAASRARRAHGAARACAAPQRLASGRPRP